MDYLIVTGSSGAGKTLAVHALEDLGYFCIDNIPAGMLAPFARLALEHNELDRVAMVLDVRGFHTAQQVQNSLQQLRQEGVRYHTLFLDAGDEVLERRYKETRRRHPLSIQLDIPTSQAIHLEREIMRPLFEQADYIVDTSLLSTAQLRGRIVGLFSQKGQGAMALNILSFGFKYGQPKEADIVFDVRCLPNPFYVPALKPLTGLDQEVVDYVMQSEASQGLLRRMQDLVGYSLPLYVQEGKSQLTIAVGCTGGKHRSITFARKLAEYVQQLGYHPTVQHRDVNRTT